MNTLGGKKKTTIKKDQKNPTQPEMVLYLSGKKYPFSFGILFSAKCQKILMTVFTERPWSVIQICSKQILNPTV